MTPLETVLAVTSAVGVIASAIAGMFAWRGRRQLREIARAEKADALAAAASERAEVREDTAEHQAVELLVARVASLEAAKDECGERLLRAAEEAKRERHKLRADMHADIVVLQGELAECREQHAGSRATVAALDARLSLLERRSSPRLPAAGGEGSGT